MAMFEKGDRPGSDAGTVIGSNVALTGALRDSHDITIHGTIEGEVATEKLLTVGESAHIKGPVIGQIISVAGTIEGSIEAHERLELLSTARVYGDIITKDLIIHSGALFVGKSAMKETTKEAHVAPKKSEPTILEPAKSAEVSPKPKYEVE